MHSVVQWHKRVMKIWSLDEPSHTSSYLCCIAYMQLVAMVLTEQQRSQRGRTCTRPQAPPQSQTLLSPP